MIIEQKPKIQCDRCGGEIREWHDDAVVAYQRVFNEDVEVLMRPLDVNNLPEPSSKAEHLCSISCRNAWLYDALRSGHIELTELGTQAMPPAAMDAEVRQ